MNENKIKIELTEHQLFLIRNAVEEYSIHSDNAYRLHSKYTEEDFEGLERLIENVLTGES